MKGLTALVVAFAVSLGVSVFSPRLQAQSISGDKVKTNTEQVVEKLRWSPSLGELKERAAKERKLIFWLQLVGELDGGL